LRSAYILRHFHKLAPLLATTYFTIFFWVENTANGFRFIDGVVVLAVLWIATLVLWVVLRFVLRDGRSIPLLMTIGAIAFHNFGMMALLLEKADVVASHKPLIAVFALVLIPTFVVIRARRIEAAMPLRVLTAVLVILTISNIVRLQADSIRNITFAIDNELISEALSGADENLARPHIYYFIFDMYASDRVLAKYLDFDNSEFLGAMESIGFQELPDSRSTYISTEFSIPSTVNMILLTDPDGTGSTMSEDYMLSVNADQIDILSTTNVGRVVEGLGYSTRSFDTRRYEEHRSIMDIFLTPFSSMFVNTVALRVIRPKIIHLWFRGTFGQHNFVNKFTPEAVIVSGDKPTFSWFYSLAPHNPFVFTADGVLRGGIIASGTPEDSDMYRRGYTDSVQYTNTKIIDIMTELIEESDEPPIIIIQGDHGPHAHLPGDIDPDRKAENLDYRAGILNLMYLPEFCTIDPPANLTTVNTFRFVLASCFGSSLDLLPDVTYYGLDLGYLDPPVLNSVTD
jgi:hypothetical protein